MRNWIRFLIGVNLILLLSLILLSDPLSFFPKTYSDSPAFINLDLENLTSMAIEENGINVSSRMSFTKDSEIWYILRETGSMKYLADPDRLIAIVQDLQKIHRFEKDKKVLSDNDFFGNRNISITLVDDQDRQFAIEFGKCYQSKSECLVREKNSRITYTIPNSIQEKVPDLRFENYLTKIPFFGIKIEEIRRIIYTSNGLLKYSIYKESGKWKTIPEIEGELNEKTIQDLLLRLVSWSGERALWIDTEKNLKTSTSNSQSISVEYRQSSGDTMTVNVEETEIFNENKKINRIKPFDQYFSMPSFGWEYWKYYDINQLTSRVE